MNKKCRGAHCAPAPSPGAPALSGESATPSATAPEIIRATKEDIDLLIEFRFLYFESQGELTPVERNSIEKQLREYFAEHLNFDCECFLLKKDGEFISSIYIIKVDRPAGTAFLNGKTAFLMNVYTKPEYRKMGAASTLLDYVIDYARECGIDTIDLSSTSMGRELYKRKGFKLRGNSEMRMAL